MKKQPSVAIIILNYNNPTDTISCIESVKQIKYLNYTIKVIDNHSTDTSVLQISNAFPDINLIQSLSNGGYAAGNNLGIKEALDEKYEYVCVLNNDVIVEENFLNILVSYAEENLKVAVCGPRICEYDNQVLIESAGSLVNMNLGKVTRLYHKDKEEVVAGKIIPCDYIGGACMLVRSSAIEQVGMIPEEYFLFYEENEWCLKFKNSGYQVVCVADSKVIHKGSATINQFTGLSEYFMYRNLVVFIKRNGTKKNKLVFTAYAILFAIKSGFTKQKGWRFTRYFLDGVMNKNQFENMNQ